VRNYDAVLFDFDGVLLDTEPVHCACWGEVLAPFGLSLPWHEYEKEYIGVADSLMIRRLCEQNGAQTHFEAVMREHPRKRELFRDRMTASAEAGHEVVALLRDLRGLDLKLAVVTSSGRVEIEPILEKTGLLPSFDTVVYGGDAARLKPAPDPYLLAAQRMKVDRPLVVEDSDPGVESARAAGFDVIRVPKQSEMTALVRAALSLD
jgi:beta-phosphoglucomutase